MIPLFLVFSFFHLASSLYGPTDEVIDLTESNFDSKVIDSRNVWLVEFYAPWCGHCKQFVPEFSKAAKALKGIAKVGAVDADQHKSLASRFSISGFPTVKIFWNKNPISYNGQRQAKDLIDAVATELKKKAYAALGIGADKSDSVANDVIELTDDNFDKLVLKSNDPWLVEFYAPWCGHCKNLAPHFKEAASRLKGKVKLGSVDATVHSSKSSEYQVQGYPTLKFFPSGKKFSSSSAEEYTGGRTADEIVQWALDKYSESLSPPEVYEISKESVVKDACESNTLCVISVLPHIYDCQSECRKAYLSTLKEVAEKYKTKQWGWIWSQAGDQPELESSLEIGGFGYPAMVILNYKKMKYSTLKGAFSVSGVSEFIRDVSYGRGGSAVVKGAKLPSIVDVEPWDGKDAELPESDDIDLSDVILEDLTKDEL